MHGTGYGRGCQCTKREGYDSARYGKKYKKVKTEVYSEKPTRGIRDNAIAQGGTCE